MKWPICWSQPRGHMHHLHFTAPRHTHTHTQKLYHLLQGDMHLTPPLFTLSLSHCVCLTLSLFYSLLVFLSCVCLLLYRRLFYCVTYTDSTAVFHLHCAFAVSHRKGCCLCLCCHLMSCTTCLSSHVIWLHDQS